VTTFAVIPDPRHAARGWAVVPSLGHRPCALGRGGVRRDKHEDDGATPVGTWPLRRVWYRADRLATAPSTALPTRVIRPTDGWCDDVASPDYNRPVELPHDARHERLWRNDAVYDVIVELGYNDDPPVPPRGSAIFLHVARPGYTPTEGCVALALEDLLILLRACKAGDALRIALPEDP
jgi:L,D-peptidoglycan transpeptidase YkuD (ErfK/YbiS/YcfS/YnhG family)